MSCPGCGNDDWKSVGLVYKEGLQERLKRGAGGRASNLRVTILEALC